MANFAQRLRQLREEAGLSQRGLAAKIGLSSASVHQWENGVASAESVRASNLAAVADALNTTVRYLLKGEGGPKNATESKIVHAYDVKSMADEEDYDPTYGVLIPVSNIEVSGGPGIAVPEFEETRYKLHFTRKWLKDMEVGPDDIKVYRVRGDSMQPILWDNDKVVIDIRHTKIRNERVFAIAYGGETRVKRLHMLAGGRLRIQSDNPDKHRFPDEILEGEEIDSVTVIGQVIHKMGEGGL